MNKKITAILMCLVLLFGSVTEAAAVTVYSKSGYDNGEEKRIADMSVIMRVGCTECYVNNQRDSFEVFQENIKPYEKDGGIYVPLSFTLNALGVPVEENADNSLSVTVNGNSLTMDEKSSEKIERRDSLLYADAAYAAEMVGAYCRKYKTTVVLSFNKEITDISDKTAESLSEMLAYNWRNAYLGSLGYITDMIAHPKNPELVYCRTDVGGFYLFDRAKEKWVPLMDGVPDSDGPGVALRSVALDPNDENVIYASGGGAYYNSPKYLFKTTDRGQSWTKLDFPGVTATSYTRLVGSDIAVDPNDSDTVFAGSYLNGLFVSHDGGMSWNSIASIPAENCWDVPSGTSHVLIDGREKLPNGRSRMIYVGIMGRGVYKSEDGGESFRLIEGSPLYPCRFQLVGDKLYISATSNTSYTVLGGFFCYENGTLTDLSPRMEAKEKHYMAFMVDYTNPDMIIVVKAPYRTSCTIYRTYDGGKNWEELGELRNPTCIMQDPIDSQGIWWPYGAGIYYVPDKDAKRLSHYDRDVNVEELVVTEVVSIPSENAPALHSLVMDHGHMISENVYDKAAGGKPYYGKGTAIDYCSEDPSLVFRAGFVQNDPYGDTLLTVSEDYGRTYTALDWNKDNTVIDAVMGAKKQENGKPLLMVVTYGDKTYNGRGIWRSKDFGKTWEMCADMVKQTDKWQYSFQSLAADRVNPNVYYYLEDRKLYRTMDGGDNWSYIHLFPNYKGKTQQYSNIFIKSVPDVEGGLWIRHGDAIYVTYDYGKTIEKLAARDVTMFGFGGGKPGSKLPAAYMWGKVNGVFGLYVSDDLGKSWRKMNDSTHNTQNMNDMCGDPLIYGRVYMATSSRGVIYCTPVEVDDKCPEITLVTKSSEPNSLSINYAVGSDTYEIKGKVSKRSEVRVNGKAAAVDGYDNFTITVELEEGENNFLIEAADENGNHAKPAELMLRYVPGFKGGEGDTEPPVLTVSEVPQTTSQKLFPLKGRLNESADVMVNHSLITVAEDLRFISIMELKEGENVIRVQARDLGKNACAPQEYKITYVPNKTADTTVLDSKHTPNGFVFDGNIEKYADLNKYMDKVAFGTVSVAAQFDTMWDEEYLYVASHVTDDIVYNGHTTSHENDSIEIYLDGDNCKGKSYNEHDKQYIFDIDTSGVDKNCIFTITDEGYNVEIRIPWSELGVTPQSGMKIGFDIDCVDNDSQYVQNGSRKGAIIWNGTAQNWSDPSVFATMTLIK